MTKSDITSEVAQATGIDKATVSAVIEGFMESVKKGMISGNDIFLRGFGTFVVKKRAQKVARNISKNTSIVIPERNVPTFKPAKSFREKMQ